MNMASAVLLSSSMSSRISTSDGSNATSSFDPSSLPTSSDPDSHIEYTFNYYDGTFPYSLPSTEFDQVVELRLERISGSSRRASGKKRMPLSDVIDGTTRTVFNVTSITLASETSSASCQRFDESSQSWTSDGCETSHVGDGGIQRDCSQRGALTVLFESGNNEVVLGALLPRSLSLRLLPLHPLLPSSLLPPHLHRSQLHITVGRNLRGLLERLDEHDLRAVDVLQPPLPTYTSDYVAQRLTYLMETSSSEDIHLEC